MQKKNKNKNLYNKKNKNIELIKFIYFALYVQTATSLSQSQCANSKDLTVKRNTHMYYLSDNLPCCKNKTKTPLLYLQTRRDI